MHIPKRLAIHLPEYTLNSLPDFAAIGTKIEALIAEHFSGKWLALRGLSSRDHPQKSAEELLEIIAKHGTDRYDPDRKGVHDDMDKKFGIETHATPMIYQKHLHCPHYLGERCPGGSPVGEILRDFYGGAILDRGYPLRLDILIVYNLKHLVPAPMKWTREGRVFTNQPSPPQDSTTFQFKNPQNKPAAILGTIWIQG